MNKPSVIAAVDLGSNSFRLQVAKVRGGLIYPQDSLKETVRMAAGLSASKLLDEKTQDRALACLTRFGERLRGLPEDSVRVVGTNTFRVAKNSEQFLERARIALGFPIEVISGHEEARLIYLGVMSQQMEGGRKLIIDIGGGSTELIIGEGLHPLRTESLYMGCVSHSMAYFLDGVVTQERMRKAELAATYELEAIRRDFSKVKVDQIIGSSGTIRAVQRVAEASGWSGASITRKSLSKLRDTLINKKKVGNLNLPGVSEERAGVLAGGVAILSSIFNSLDINEMHTTSSGLREGVLFDLIERFENHDVREATVQEFMRHYSVETDHALRIEKTALALFKQLKLVEANYWEKLERFVSWASRLHEIGISISYSGYHRHSAYILENSDMPGFSKKGQAHLAHLVYAMRASANKVSPQITGPQDWLTVLILRLATILHRGRTEIKLPKIKIIYTGKQLNLYLEKKWLGSNLLVESVLHAELKSWDDLGYRVVLQEL